MATLNYDPRWFDFLKSQPNPAPSPDALTEMGQLGSLTLGIQDPNSPNYKKYLQSGEFAALYPELMKSREAESSRQNSLIELFQKQYGISPVTKVGIPRETLRSSAPAIEPPGASSMIAPPPIISAPPTSPMVPQMNLAESATQIPMPGQLVEQAQHSPLFDIQKMGLLGDNWSTMFQS